MSDDFNNFNFDDLGLDDILSDEYSLDDILGEDLGADIEEPDYFGERAYLVNDDDDENYDFYEESDAEASEETGEEPDEEPDVDITFRSSGKAKKREAEESHSRYPSEKELRRLEKQRKKEEKQRLQDQEEVERERQKEEKKRIRAEGKTRRTIRWVVAIVFLSILIAGIIIGGLKVSRSQKILPNIYIADIPIGGLTREQAAETLTQANWRERSENPLVIKSIGGVTAELNPITAGADLTLEQAVDAAYKYGHIGNIFENLITFIETTIRPVNINALYQKINDEYINNTVSQIAVAVKEYMGNEEYTVDQENSVLRMKKGWSNLELNTNAFHDAIVTALKNGDPELEFAVVKNAPERPDFNALHTLLAAEPADAYYSADGRFEVTDEIVGCKFDVNKADELWSEAAPGDEVDIPLDITYPKVTGDDLRSQLYCHLLGAMTTRYTNSAENRCSNVRLASSRINGHVLYPGEEFSFNEYIGARTEAAGFLPAPAYAAVGEDGVKDEIGGGCCQVSSTLYAATVFSFLETVERHNHVYAVNYIQLGTDATVTIPEEGNEMDFKFRNNRAYPIKMVAYTNETEEEKSITFEIWGTLEPDDYMPVEFDNSYSWTFDYDRVIDPAFKDRPGYKIKLTHETYNFADEIGPGYRTLTHREIFDSEGNMISDEILNPEIASGPAMDTYYHHEH